MHNVKNDGEKMYFAHFRPLGKAKKESISTDTTAQYFCTVSAEIGSKGPKNLKTSVFYEFPIFQTQAMAETLSSILGSEST
jgi:hypothetical protein